MDSSAAVRNLYNQGGRIRALILLYKNWMSLCEANHITGTYVWLPRELNTRADELSKRTQHTWSLNGDVEASLAHGLGCNETPTLPDFNKIGLLLDDAARTERTLLLVHPVWRSASWWVRLCDMAVRHMALPDAGVTLRDGPTDLNQAHIPAWKMQASVIAPRRSPAQRDTVA